MVANQNREGLLSPFLRKCRIKAALPFLKGKILDVGCADGILCENTSRADYTGVDINGDLLIEARKNKPGYEFYDYYPAGRQYDTIVALAVVEHVKDPQKWIQDLSHFLKQDGKMVLTTPHPRGRRIHEVGATLGVFSHHAAEEHESFLDEKSMHTIADRAGLLLVTSKNFLLGFNQLFVLQKPST